MPYMPQTPSHPVVPKAWGYEFVAYDSGAAAVTILHIARKRMTSKHCHPNKDTKLVCLSGKLKVTLNDGLIQILEPLQWIAIPKGVYHRTEAIADSDLYPSAENGCWLLEIEEPSDKTDLVRAEDAYGRAGQPYETEAVPYTGKILRLSERPQRFMGYEFWTGEAYTKARSEERRVGKECRL